MKDEKFPSKRGQVPPTQPLMEKTFRRKHIIISFKKHMFGNHCKRARAKPEFDKKKFFKNWSNRDCSHKKVLPMKFVACANKLKFLKRNSPLILHSTKARRSFQTNKFSDGYKRNAQKCKHQKHEMSDKRCAANGGTPFLNTGDGFSTFRPSGLRVWPFSCEKTLKSKEIISRVGKQKKKGRKDEKFPSKRGQVPPPNP